MNKYWINAKDILQNNGVVVLPTDTLYGVVCSAFSKKTVEKIYKIKGRSENKPFIILITSYKDLDLFGIKINNDETKTLKKIWPGKVSVILPCKSNKFKYIHRGEGSIAFRMIGSRNKNLFNLLKKVGPLVAPSANIEGFKPSENINEAKIYFKDNVDLYVNGGNKILIPSTLVKFENNKLVVLRQGQVKIN